MTEATKLNIDVSVNTHYPNEQEIQEVIEDVLSSHIGDTWGENMLNTMRKEITARILPAISYDIVIHDRGQRHHIDIKF
ncbi:hypothetical protein J1782_25140 [Rahnella sp. BCC 1045]|uniref:hypothetical protein n=1 Tax=Rahnella sp. BCC 1045 TaxID=2816251 RepID=UPI001C261713|nr:hypothetical protein [Rahnella sp. BCC 1045]MBU9823180.1 hypothetical protein [Rahnella sp. BCC 1045]